MWVPSWFILWRTMLNSCSFRQISLRMGRVRSGILKHSFHNTTDIFSQKLGSDEKKILKTRALAIRWLSLYNGHFFVETQVSKRKIFKKYAPLLLRKRERVVSADMRFERVASTSGVRTHRKNGKFSFAPDLLILLLGNPHTPFVSNLKILPELFRKPLFLFALTIIIILCFYKQTQN